MIELTAPPVGRRQANKDAVRTGLRDAARRLFAERGYEATTVREIARAAGVTERTFYRYFDGKEGILAAESLAWLETLTDAIVNRPSDEPPLRAVLEAARTVINAEGLGFGPVHMWLFSSQRRPFATIRRFSPRPLIRLERSVTKALLARASGTPAGDPSPEVAPEAAVLARVAVAAMRSAVASARDPRESDDPDASTRLDAALVKTFAIIGTHSREFADDQ